MMDFRIPTQSIVRRARGRERLRKGDTTRVAILEQALHIASIDGLEALSLGVLAEHMQMSKSGVYARFGSKLALQLEVLWLYRCRFEEAVFYPAMEAPAGLPRLRALFRNWSDHVVSKNGLGCFYVSCASEYDDRSGPLRDALLKDVVAWRQAIEKCIRQAVEMRHFREDTDAGQVAYEMLGLVLMLHHDIRLLGDDESMPRSRQAFDRLIVTHQAGDSLVQASCAENAPHRLKNT